MDLSCLFIILGNLITLAVETSQTKDDPSLFPGHLEPLGVKQPKYEIEELLDYPTPKDFFESYVKERRPFLVKKGAFNQSAYKLWNDRYLTSFPQALTELVDVEPNKKEVRNAPGISISLTEFISRYHQEEIYMVNKVPSFLQKDVVMPSPLHCNSTRKLMLDHIVWMSSGGTKSVLHYDNLDNINCLLRGSKEILMIPPKHEHKVPMDLGAYSSLDVDRVNFTQYPTMREVEYIHCSMNEGDCIFIPFEWPHQVNSVANDNNENIAVNIWFLHDPNHKVEGCEVLPEENTTINNWTFQGMESYFSRLKTSEVAYYTELFAYLLTQSKSHRLTLQTFIKFVLKVDGVFLKDSIKHLKPTEELLIALEELFDRLDYNKDDYFDENDLSVLEEDEEATFELVNWLDGQFVLIRNILLKNLLKSDGETVNFEERKILLEKQKTEL